MPRSAKGSPVESVHDFEIAHWNDAPALQRADVPLAGRSDQNSSAGGTLGSTLKACKIKPCHKAFLCYFDAPFFGGKNRTEKGKRPFRIRVNAVCRAGLFSSLLTKRQRRRLGHNNIKHNPVFRGMPQNN